MIENIRNSLQEIETNIGEANTELVNVYKSLQVSDEETNLQRLEKLGTMLEEAHLTSSLVATHYQAASGHRRTAEEAIIASGVSVEHVIGEKILGAMIRGAGTMDAMPSYSEGLHGQLKDLEHRLIAYGQLEETKGRAERKARLGVDMCALSLKAATDTTTNLKKVL